MIRDYDLASPSLEGVLSDVSLVYEGIRRPIEVLRVFDGPAAKGQGKRRNKTEEEQKMLAEYFQDLYGVFMKKLSHFIVENDLASEDGVKLMALLQEMIKIKKLMQ